MERPGNQNSHHENRGNVDSSLGAKLAAKGIFVEAVQSKQDQSAELKELLTAKLLEKSKNENRNHEGNGRQAGPELTTALKEAGVVTAAEREATIAQFMSEKSAIQNEVAEAKARIAKAKQEKDWRTAHNWDIRLKSSEDILSIYKEVESVIKTDATPETLEGVRRYRKARIDQAQKEIARDDFEKTGKFAAVKELGVVNEETLPTLKDVADPNELPLLPKEHSIPVRMRYKGDDIHTILADDLSKMEAIDTTTEPKLTPSERISYPQEESVVLLTNTNNETTSMENFPTQATGDNWQEDAFAKFEEEKTINTLTRLTALAGGATETPKNQPASKATEGVVAIMHAEQEVSKETRAGESLETPEQKKERILKAIYDPEKLSAIEARAEVAGLPKEALRNIGETWNKVPLRTKLLISTGMILSGSTLGLGAAATPAFIAASMALRGLGGVGMFATIEHKLKERSESKSGTKRTQKEEAIHLAIAGGVAVIVAGVLPTVLREYAVEHWFSPEAPTETGSAATPEGEAFAPVAYIEIAQPGDSVWKMTERGIEASLGEKFTSLSPEQQTYLIDAVKDQITAHPDQFGVTNVENIEVGQGIDFGIILNNQEFMTDTLAEAKGLSAENIGGKGYTEVGPRTLSPEELVAEPETKDFTIPRGILDQAPTFQGTPATIEASGLKMTFHYAPDGTVNGISSSETTGFGQHAEAQKLLNDNWHAAVREHTTSGEMSKNYILVNERANTLFQQDQILNALEQRGQGSSPEANFLREQLEKLVTDTEKEYGDVFKDTTELFKSEQAIPTPAVAAPESVIPTSAPAPTIPQEVVPADPQIAAASDKLFHNHVDDVFGSKGFLGFGAVDGSETPNWKDPEVGFANKTIEQVVNAKPITIPGSEQHFGIEDQSATNKMKDYLNQTFIETGIQPTEGETVEKYLKRVSVESVLHERPEEIQAPKTQAATTLPRVEEPSTTNIVTEKTTQGGVTVEKTGAETVLTGSTGQEFLSKDYNAKMIHSGAGFGFDKQMAMTTSRGISAQVAAYNDLLAAGKTDEAAQHLSSIYKAVDMADKTLGEGVIDRTKLPPLK